MPAILRALIASFFILEITGALALGLSTIVLLGLHAHGIVFWSVEALSAAGATYVTSLFYLRALAYERSVISAEI